MTSPWLTVVLPVHNGELYLETALQSLAVQNDKDIECVVVDSSDSNGCLDIVERFAHILTLDAHRRPALDGKNQFRRVDCSRRNDLHAASRRYVAAGTGRCTPP